MKILVPIKRVIDPYVTIRVKTDESGVETDNVKMSMNPFCEIAVEEAVRLKESGVATEVIAVTVGSQDSQETLRSALAIGADRAILIESEHELQPLAVAKTLQAVVAKEDPRLVLMGKQAIDNDNNQTGQMLAGLLGWGQGTFISEQSINGDQITVTREVDGGLETNTVNLPAILTTDLRLNEPRYIKLPNIMQAKRKPLETISTGDLGLDEAAIKPRFQVLKVQEPTARAAGIKVESVAELVDKLRNQENLI